MSKFAHTLCTSSCSSRSSISLSTRLAVESSVTSTRVGRHHLEIGRVDGDRGLVQRAVHPGKVRGRARDHPLIALVTQVLPACFERGGHELVLADGLRDHHHALALELPGDRARLGHRAAVAGEQRPDLRPGPIPVVREALDDHRDAGGGIALVGDRFITDAFELAGAAFDRALDRVQRHGRVPGLGEHRAERGVGGHVPPTLPSSDLDLADQLGEQLASSRVDGTLAMLGGCPLGMTRHRLSLPRCPMTGAGTNVGLPPAQGGTIPA